MRLFDFFHSSVLFRCDGGYPARFLDTAAEDGIALWDIHYCRGALLCRADAADYRRLRRAARRGCVRMRLQRRYGLFFRLRRFHLRFGLAVGIMLSALLLSFLSSRIWVIRVCGNQAVSTDAVLAALEPLGIVEGGVFSEVDLNELQLTVLQKLPGVTWLTVNRSGSIVTVEVQESTPTEPLPDTAPANLVAACDGVILQITAVSGQPVVQVGDAVTQGDLLISGVMNSSVGPQLKRAAGQVLARVTRTVTVTVPLRETVVRQAGVTDDRLSLLLFGIAVPLYTDSPTDSDALGTTYRSAVKVNGTALPIGWSVTRYRHVVTEQLTHTPQEAEQLAQTRLADAEATLRETLAVESRTLRQEITDGGITLTAVYIGTQELAVAVPIE